MKAFRILRTNLLESFKGVFRNFSLSLASISCITITLILVGFSIILSYNVNSLTRKIEKDMTIVVFLDRKVSDDQIKAARKNIGGIAHIVEGDNNNLPFADKNFDIITAKNVTMFNSDELYRVLQEGGYFIFREYGQSKGLVEVASLFKDRLIRSRNVGFYSTKLENSGFEIISIEQYQVFRKYQSVQEIINITKSFPFIENYSNKDEEIIKESLNGNCNITSDPFILVARKKES